MHSIKRHLPQRQEIAYVFGVIVFLVYSWSIRGFFYQLSSLRLYHSAGEILAVFCYLMAFALVESLIVLGSLLLVGLVLPGRWFRDGFAYKGFLTILVAGIAMILLNDYLFSLSHAMPPLTNISLGAGLTIASITFLIWLAQRLPKLQQLLLTVQERMQIFIYFYVPLGLLAWLVLISRNLG